MSNIQNLVMRIFAVFILGALGTIGAAAIFNVPPIVGAGIAGLLSVADVIKELAHAFLDDGKLTKKEIDDILHKKSAQMKGKSNDA